MKIDIKKIALILAAGIFAISGAFGADDEVKMPEWNIRVVNNLKMFTLDVDVFPKGPRPQMPVSIKDVQPQTTSENVPFKGDIGYVEATAKKEVKITGPQAEVASASLGGGNEETVEIDLSNITGSTDEEIGIESWKKGKGKGKGKGKWQGKGKGKSKKFRNPIIYTVSTEGNTIILTFERAGKKVITE